MLEKKKDLLKIVLGAVFLIFGMLVEHDIIDIMSLLPSTGVFVYENIILTWFLAGYLIIGGDVLKTAIHNIFKGQVFDENFLMSIASLGAFFVGEYPEALAVILFYQIGEFFQDYAVNKSRRSIAEIMDIRPDVAFVKENDGTIVKKKPKDVRIGQIIVVKPGERVPLDGKLAKGQGMVDTSALTGESLPRELSEGDEVISGSISINTVLEIVVEKEYGESTVAKILELVENASNRKAATEKFITKFARYYTPIVVISALVLAIVPSLFEGATSIDIWSKWIYRALSFLVTSCPCALVISVPLSFFGGIGGASANGVLIKGSNYLEILAKCDTVVFDKTGTLTKGNFKVSNINAIDGDKENLLYSAAYAEFYSNHPIAISIVDELKNNYPNLYEKFASDRTNASVASGYQEMSGHGVKAILPMGTVIAGNKRLMDNEGIECSEVSEFGTVVHISLDKKYMGYLTISDEIKESSKEAIDDLKKAGISNTVMLTGDKKEIGEYVASVIGIDNVYTELLPADKVEYMENIISNKKNDRKVAFVGDGINDAPVLARADIGIAMGALGSDAAIEAADIVLMDDDPKGIVKAIKVAKKTLKIVKQNIVFAIGVKVLILVLAAVGIATMWAAVFADVGVAFLAILNALRAMRR